MDEELVNNVAEALWDWKLGHSEMPWKKHLLHMKKYDCDVSWQEQVSETKAEARRIIEIVRGNNKG